MEEITNKKGMSAGMLVGIIIIGGIVFVSGAYLYANNQATKEKEVLNTQIIALQKELADAKKTSTTNPSNETTDTSNKTTDTTTKASIPTGWKTYENDAYGYSLSYPTDWKITVADIDPSTVADNDLNKLIGGVHSISFNDETVQGPVFALEIMNKSIDNAIAADKSVYGTRTGESVTIGGVVGEKLSGAFYGMQYINKDGKTYFFEQQNAASDADKKDFDKVMGSFRFIGI